MCRTTAGRSATKIRAVLLAVGLAVAGCTGEHPPAKPVAGGSSGAGSLVIWADQARGAALRPFAERFARSKGISVRVTAPTDLTAGGLIEAVRRGAGPDLVAGPHEWIGALVRAGVIQPVELSGEQRGKFATASIDAVTFEKRYYGVPFAIENAALIRNLRLAADPPRTIEEAVAIGEQLKRAGKVTAAIGYPVGPAGDSYHLYPLYVSGGGRLFGGKSDSDPELRDLGLAEPEGIEAFSKIAMLGVRGSGALTPAVDVEAAVSAFVQGKTPFLVAGPEVLPRLRQAGFEYDVSAVPGFHNGKPNGPLIKVSAMFVTSQCRDQAVAGELLTSLLAKPEVAAALYAADPRPPALTEGFRKVKLTDSDVQRFFDTGRGGLLIPTIPQMSRVWGPFGEAEVAVLAGAEVPAAVQNAVTAILSGR